MNDIEKLIREGKTIEDIVKMAETAKETMDKEAEEKAAAEKAEKERQEKIIEARDVLTDAFVDYVITVTGETPKEEQVDAFVIGLKKIEKPENYRYKKFTVNGKDMTDKLTDAEIDDKLDKIFKLFFY